MTVINGNANNNIAADHFTFGAAPGGKVIALTFDDGPWSVAAGGDTNSTQEIKAILNSFGVKATFFEIGNQIGDNAALVKSLTDDGMLVENHTWDHQDLTTLSTAQITAEFQQTTDAITAATGTVPEYFRPPYGNDNPTVDGIAAGMGMQPVIWTVDTMDGNDSPPVPSTAQIVQAALTGATDGGVVLMHDGGGNREQTVAALPDIIKGLEAQGYQIVTLHDIPNLPVDFDGGTVANHHYHDLVV